MTDSWDLPKVLRAETHLRYSTKLLHLIQEDQLAYARLDIITPITLLPRHEVLHVCATPPGAPSNPI